MTEGLSKQLEILAAKLNVSVDVLWGALLKQAFIDGVSDLIIYGFMLGVYVAMYAWGRTVYRRVRNRDWDDIAWLPFGAVCMVAFFVSLVIWSHLPMTYAAFFNPEYWAYKHLRF